MLYLYVGGLFVMGAIPISLYTIMMHLINYTAPYLQRYIIRILWMVPIYAIDAVSESEVTAEART